MQFTAGEDLQKTILNAPIGICLAECRYIVAELVNDKFLEVAGKPYETIFGQFLLGRLRGRCGLIMNQRCCGW
jgi:hypothetical protein